jgi:putative endonuclease
MTYYIYIIECSNNSFYTGYTTDIERRYQEHLQGNSKCKYTRSFPPKRLAAYWEIDQPISDILKIEKKIKNLNRAQKIALIQSKDLFASID